MAAKGGGGPLADSRAALTFAAVFDSVGRPHSMKARLLFALFFATLALDLWRIGDRFDWLMLPAAFAGWWLADMLSGVVHMYMDYRPCTPGMGLADLYFWPGSRDSQEFAERQAQVYARISTFERIVYDFKKHHPMPDLLGRHGLFHLMKAPTFFVALPISLVVSLIFLVWQAPGWLIVGTVVLLVGASLTQYFHGSLHRERSCFAVRAMRRLGLLMSHDAHARHHEALVRDFSVISGWSNPAVNVLVRVLLQRGLLDEAGLEPT